ncbi:unnamed protein product [Caenorhabditis auriculariae]|uniref:Uncharacterized protein n=1 Tax=Caenorhabditis auriculariae TaxID=2777116 RepID=A0A8S1HFB1_9PELO|nr:unnamed protein product [Caenorhabditis auriculariae]
MSESVTRSVSAANVSEKFQGSLKSADATKAVTRNALTSGSLYRVTFCAVHSSRQLRSTAENSAKQGRSFHRRNLLAAVMQVAMICATMLPPFVYFSLSTLLLYQNQTLTDLFTIWFETHCIAASAVLLLAEKNYRKFLARIPGNFLKNLKRHVGQKSSLGPVRNGRFFGVIRVNPVNEESTSVQATAPIALVSQSTDN